VNTGAGRNSSFRTPFCPKHIFSRIRFSFVILALPAIIGFNYNSTAQTLDQVLSRHLEATGQRQLSRVMTVRSEGKAVQMGMEMPFIQIQKRPDKMYLEIDIQGMKMTQSFNGERGWAVEPWMSNEPRELTGPELKYVRQTANIDSDLVNWQEKGYQLEYMGHEPLEGRQAYRLRLQRAEDETYEYYLDSETYLISKMVVQTNYEGNIVEGETILGDYRSIGGISVPFRTEVRYGGQTLMTNVIDKVEFDVAIDDKVFSRP